MRTLSLVLLAACGSSPPPPAHPRDPGSRGMRADAHVAAAYAHEARAAELAKWPEMERDVTGFETPTSGLWFRAWDTTPDERRQAEQHLSEAARLQAEFDAACADIPADEVSVSPLVRHGVGGMATASGMTVLLSSDAGPPDRLLAKLRCHRAWMMLGEAGMDECPLDLAGLQVRAYGDAHGVSVELTVSDASLVAELQRRASKDLERAMARPMH